MGLDPITVVMLVAIAYLLYKVYLLEKLVQGGGGRRGPRPFGEPRPILKDKIEPGPFAGGNRTKKD